MYQKLSLTNTLSTAQLDSGLLSVSSLFWEKISDAPLLDTGQVTLIFLSAKNISLCSATTGPKACISAWCRVAGNWPRPVRTRAINYVMKFIANFGSFADAWIDDNALNITCARKTDVKRNQHQQLK